MSLFHHGIYYVNSLCSCLCVLLTTVKFVFFTLRVISPLSVWPSAFLPCYCHTIPKTNKLDLSTRLSFVLHRLMSKQLQCTMCHFLFLFSCTFVLPSETILFAWSFCKISFQMPASVEIGLTNYNMLLNILLTYLLNTLVLSSILQ